MLTAAALLAALVGLPIALFQLFAVERDIARLSLVPPMHYEQLRGMLEGSQLALGREVPFDFGDQPNGRPLFRKAFFAHLPDLEKAFADWDAAVARVEAARASFAAALERAADAVGVDAPAYDRGAILQRLQERSRPSLHLILEEWPSDSIQVRGSTNGSVDVAGTRANLQRPRDKYGADRALTEDELRRLLTPLIDLCDAARTLPEIRVVAEAQDSLTQLMPALSDEIKLHSMTETVPVVQRCPICQRNLGA